MAIQFRCPVCTRKLSIGSRKAGVQTRCPGCRSDITVPAAEDIADPAAEDIADSWQHPRRTERRTRRSTWVVAGIGVAVVVLTGVAAILLWPKPAEPQFAQNTPVEAKLVPPVPQPVEQPAIPLPPTPQPTPQLPPTPEVPQGQPQEPPRTDPQPAPMVPQAVVPPAPPMPLPLDQFGNPVGNNAGLGRDGEFAGKRLLFWSGFENAGRVFFAPNSPLWKGLEAQGFEVHRVFGRFNPGWLKDCDQLWILSTGRLELPPGITPDLLEFAVTQLPPAAIPSGFTLAEYQLIVRATLDVMYGPMHPLDEKAYAAIGDFVKAGKGLCVLADDEPFTVEANQLAKRLFGASVGGNFLGDKVASVQGRGLPPADIRKFNGQFIVDDHLLLTGVNFVYEGITVSHVAESEKLEVALKSSNGQAVVAVSKVPGQRVVFDCGFTRYCHGPIERTSYILKTAGTVRLAQNIAAYLAHKGERKK